MLFLGHAGKTTESTWRQTWRWVLSVFKAFEELVCEKASPPNYLAGASFTSHAPEYWQVMSFLLHLFIYFVFFFLSLKLECLFGLSSELLEVWVQAPHRSAKRDQKAFSESRGAMQTEVNSKTDSAEIVDYKQEGRELWGRMLSQQVYGLSATEQVHFPITDFFLWFGCTG